MKFSIYLFNEIFAKRHFPTDFRVLLNRELPQFNYPFQWYDSSPKNRIPIQQVNKPLLEQSGGPSSHMFCGEKNLKCRVFILKSLPVLHRSTDAIFQVFGITELILSYSDYIVLKYLLVGVSKVAVTTASHEIKPSLAYSYLE